MVTEEFDQVDHPEHYAKGSLECIDWIRAFLTSEEYHGYLKGNILKYIWRYEDKGAPEQDLGKAKKYIDFILEDIQRQKEHEEFERLVNR